jgi:hypothetical protein
VVDESHLKATVMLWTITMKRRLNLIAGMPPSRTDPLPKTAPVRDYEDSIQAAKEGYLNGRFKSLQEAADYHDVSN